MASNTAVFNVGLSRKSKTAATMPMNRNSNPFNLIQNGFERSFIIQIQISLMLIVILVVNFSRMRMTKRTKMSSWEQAQNRLGRASRRAGFAERDNDFGELCLDFYPARLILQQFQRRAGEIFWCGIMLDEFRINRLAREQVWHRQRFHRDDAPGNLIS